MSNPTLGQILGRTKALTARIHEKRAQASMEGISSMPGSEHDKSVPKSLENPDPEVADGSMGPDSARTVAGAGDDRPITAGSLFEADEPVLNPTKKPETTADANAKTASDARANDILGLIRKIQTVKKAQEADKTDEMAESAPGADSVSSPEKLEADEPAVDNKEKPETSADANAKEAEKTCSKCGKSASECKCGGCSSKKASFNKESFKAAVAEGVRRSIAKQAAVNEIMARMAAEEQARQTKQAEPVDELGMTLDIMAKLAGYMLATEEGVKLAERELTAREGVKQAAAQLDFLEKKSQELEGAAAADALIDAGEAAQGAADADALIDEAQGAADANAMIDAAQNAEAAAPAADEGAGGGDDGGDPTPEEIAEAINEMLEEGTITPEQVESLVSDLPVEETGTGEVEGDDMGDITEQDVADTIVEMVENGEISPEQAQQVAATLAGQFESPADVQAIAGAVADAAPADVAATDPAAAVPEEAAKTASYNPVIDRVRRNFGL